MKLASNIGQWILGIALVATLSGCASVSVKNLDGGALPFLRP